MSAARWDTHYVMNGDPSPISLELQWFVPTFIVAWFAMSGLLALMSGWVSLGRLFEASGPVTGKRFRFTSGSIGRRFLPVSYGNCLFVTTNDKGLHLSILYLFRFMSPPLFIPWSRFESVERRRVLFIPYYVLTIREHWARIVLAPRPGRSAKEAYDSAVSAMAV